MLRVFVVTVMVLAGAAALSSARAATVTGDVFVDLFPTGPAADLTIFEAGALSSDPTGAAALTLSGTLETIGTPTVASGALALADSGGAEYLSGALTGISFVFSDTGEDTITLQITPISGSALTIFQPLVVAAVTGEFGDTLAGALASGVAFAEGRIEVSQVPVPAALPLLATGLCALAFWRRRRQVEE